MARRKLLADLTPNGMGQGDRYNLYANLVDLITELQANYALTKTLLNNLRRNSMNRALGACGLAIGGTTTSYKHTTAVNFVYGGILKLSATTADHAFTAADVITQNTWGAWVVTLAGTTWKTTRVGASPMAYASEALAIAAAQSMTLPTDEAVMGMITVRARSTVDFTANTTNLTADNGSGNAQTVNYYDGALDDMPGVRAADELPAPVLTEAVRLTAG